MKTGNNFKYPANKAPLRALLMSFADKARWTMY